MTKDRMGAQKVYGFIAIMSGLGNAPSGKRVDLEAAYHWRDENKIYETNRCEGRRKPDVSLDGRAA